MASPYKLSGGATRADAISGLDPAFNQALIALYNAAPPEVQRELGLTSAYRSIARQQELWNASDKSGKWVAAPGKSKHNFGLAADLTGFGLKEGAGAVSQATKDWVRANAAKYNLAFPMAHEPWHIELAKVDAQMQAAGYTPEQRRAAIASIESAGSGDYGALGPLVGEARDRAYGKYQVMGSNIGPWAEQYLQRKGVTPEQFLKDPALQDKLFDAVYGDYVSKYGERGAASKWFTGSENEPAVTDVNKKLTGKTYADRYMEALTGTPRAVHPPNPQTGTGGYVAPGAPRDQPLPPAVAAAVPAAAGGKKDTALEAMAKAGMGGAGGSSGWQMPQLPEQVGAARVDQPATPTFDPQQTEYRRQMLAQILARLNQGSLV
jgi:hypothetical protein